MTENKKCTCSKYDDVKMSVPEGMEFNTSYSMNHTMYTENYWDTDRNKEYQSPQKKPRLDDKLARIKNKGINDKTEDTVDDLIGYLLLLKMSM